MYVFLITSEISYHSILYLDKLVVDFAEQFNEKLFIKQILDVSSDALPSHGGETQVRVSQSQVAGLGLGSTLPASNSRKG
jgi:hypothetical protein